MNKMKEIAPSILSAHRGYLLRDVNEVLEAGANMLHIDVMDNHFVPNLGYDKQTVAMLKEMTDATLDVHLMMYQPEQCIDSFIHQGADMLTIHVESTPHVYRAIQQIKEAGVKAGIAVNPGTSLMNIEPVLNQVDHVVLMSVNPGFGGQQFIPESVERIENLVQMRAHSHSEFKIEVDGGVNRSTIGLCAEAGADILVAGSAVFNKEGITHSYNQLQRLL